VDVVHAQASGAMEAGKGMPSINRLHGLLATNSCVNLFEYRSTIAKMDFSRL
jgi:hypothetical protein